MNATQILGKFDATHTTWRQRLAPLSEDAIERRPDDGGWSIGQVCWHIGAVSDMLLENCERCTAGDGERRAFSLTPALISAVGTLPPARIKVPPLPPELEHLGAPEPLTKDAALARLEAVAERMRSLRDAVAAAPTNIRRPHPAGGWMHARQWYQMTEMHLRHHLRQLARLV